MQNGRAHAIGWAAFIIGALAVLRMLKGAGDPPYGVDASYYFQLARHIANGDGFVTTVSLYHEGWILPAKTNIYPLWPLVLGYAGRMIGIEIANEKAPMSDPRADAVMAAPSARPASPFFDIG